MAKTKISEFSSTPANNTDIDSINIAEGCAPSGINDAIRELMAQLKDFQTGAAGDSFNGPVGTTTAAAGAFTTLAASGAVTLSGGTANGVAYLNGSKVLTTGSALVFDGTNLGLGVTPSAWTSGYTVAQIGSQGSLSAFTDGSLRLGSNWRDSSGIKYLANGFATIYRQELGAHTWFTAPSGTAGNAISFTQAMTLDASGNLLVGGTSQLQSARITSYGSVSAQNSGVDGTFANAFVGVFSSNSNEHNAIQTAVSSGGTGSGFRFRASDGGGSSGTTTVLDLTRTQTIFYTGGSERARIDSSGNLLVAKTVSTATVNGIVLGNGGTLYATSNSDCAELYRKTTDAAVGVMLVKSDIGGTASLKGVAYANGTFGAVSDAIMKKNVEDARGYLDDLMQIRVVKYNWKTDEDSAAKELGWIAQEVAEVFPGMVSEMEGSKLLKKEVFLPMMLKAIQELKADLDATKAELAALKGNP
jgi:hypothetical protein